MFTYHLVRGKLDADGGIGILSILNQGDIIPSHGLGGRTVAIRDDVDEVLGRRSSQGCVCKQATNGEDTSVGTHNGEKVREMVSLTVPGIESPTSY